jgi:hypothetical protein
MPGATFSAPGTATVTTPAGVTVTGAYIVTGTKPPFLNATIGLPTVMQLGATSWPLAFADPLP